MELSDNDKQRIEQEAIRLTNWETGYTPLDKNSGFYRGILKGAEYATLYERQQQANGLKSIENPDHHIKVLKEQIQRIDKEYKELEAERSNIETLLHKILKESVGGNAPFSFELYNEIKAALNL